MAKRWTEDVGAWASSLRFSGFTILIVGLVVAGALILSPTLTTFVQQQREIKELRESVQLHRDAVNEIDAEREKWKDPTYIRSQARDRLFYVLPGETQLSVIDDAEIPEDVTETTEAELTHIDRDWVSSLAGSLIAAGTTDAEPEELTRAGLGDDPPAEPAEPSEEEVE